MIYAKTFLVLRTPESGRVADKAESRVVLPSGTLCYLRPDSVFSEYHLVKYHGYVMEICLTSNKHAIVPTEYLKGLGPHSGVLPFQPHSYFNMGSVRACQLYSRPVSHARKNKLI